MIQEKVRSITQSHYPQKSFSVSEWLPWVFPFLICLYDILIRSARQEVQHLTAGVPAFLTRYEQHAGNSQVARMIVDREGMATEFLASLHAEGRNVVTILQTNQYQDLTSFHDVGTFVPLRTDTHGRNIREVAPARIPLLREDQPDTPLCLQVALIRDLRRTD